MSCFWTRHLICYFQHLCSNSGGFLEVWTHHTTTNKGHQSKPEVCDYSKISVALFAIHSFVIINVKNRLGTCSAKLLLRTEEVFIS